MFTSDRPSSLFCPLQPLRIAAGAGVLLILTSCSSSSGSNNGRVTAAKAPEWTAGVYAPSSDYANYCVAPKSGTNPFTGQPYGHKRGTAMHEKMWLRSISNELYLWYDLLPDPNPASYTTIEYFNTQKTDFDRFHYSAPIEEYFSSNQSGVYVDHGVRWHFEHNPPFRIRVADIFSAYDLDSIINRGDTVVAVDGVNLGNNTDAEIDIIENGLFPTVDDPNHVITFRDINTGSLKDIMLTARALEHDAVRRHSSFDHNGTTFGYLQFDGHSALAEPLLINAVQDFDETGIDELILDLRYNQGGYLYIASQLSYMIAGAAVTDGMPFIFPRYNDKYQYSTDSTVDYLPFLTMGEADTTGTGEVTVMSLPTLDLDRVYVLTSGATCSASEAIINGLKGVGVEVVQVGETTCGKPYTFVPMENCGVVYSTVVFSNENALGFGDYINGFRPTDGSLIESEAVLPGCRGNDDVDHPLGSVNEGMVAAALHWHENGACPDVVSTAVRLQSKSSVGQPPWIFEGARSMPSKPGAIMLPQAQELRRD